MQKRRFLYTYLVQIRPITDSDLPAVLEVYRQCEDFLALGPVPRASMQMVEADRELSSRQGGEFCGLFAADGTLMGVLDFIRAGWEDDPGCAFLELLMIAAPYRNRGLGEEALRWLEGELSRQHPPVCHLKAGVQVNNPGAVRFWQRMGFAIISEAEVMADGTVCYQLEKDL